ncbi:hypothetical protein F4553_004305 [Allocatelliglobosispora scoriae]|uniref:Fibronectin type-III domain-containing protein n=1 Tax=Allocatelliglobosispora scoriae TaxID=643052 RepID=A0A841BU12_9ACTN|nr:PD40 domain-containing protein [Allocatelliglobosispora scoriae]MBB5870926.1 hypothetical protein [Allocatelliglobosispora scoriae]
MRRPLPLVLVPILVGALLHAPAAYAAPPAGPASVTAGVEGLNLSVDWTPPADATGVTGYRLTTVPAGPALEVPVGTDHAVLTGARPNTAYSVRVSSLAGAEESAPTTAGQQVSTAAPGGSLHGITPTRLLDTRSGLGAPKGPTQQVSLLVTGGAPEGGSVVLNVTVTAPAAAGYLTAYPDGIARPTSSNLNFAGGQTLANLVVVPIGAGGRVILYSSAPTQLIADMAGWFTTPAQASPSAGLFHGINPARLMDTREELGGSTPALGETVELQVTGEGGVPAEGVAAVVLNLVAAGPLGAGYVTVFPTGAPRPTASTLNFAARQVVANRIIVPVGTDGKVSFFNQAEWTPLVVDVAGWFTDGSDPASGGSYLAGVTPTRIVDTRSGLGAPKAPIGPAATLPVTIAGKAGLPSASAATPPSGVIASITAIAPTAAGYFTAYPSLTARPTASDLNFAAGATVPTLAVTPLGVDGDLMIYNQAGSTHVIVDIVGYFVGDTAIPSTTHDPAPGAVTQVDGAPGGDQVVTLAPAAAVPEIGEVIAEGATAAAPDGLLVRVTAASTDGAGNHVLETEPATMQEAFGNGHFAISAQLSDADVQTFGSAKTLGPDLLRRRLSGDAPITSVSQPIGKVLTCGGGGQISVTGSLSVTPSFNISVDWGWLSIKSVSFTGTLAEDASLVATAQAAANCSVGPVALLPAPVRFAPITFSVGPVPVVITPQLQFYLSAQGNVTAQITASAVQHASGTLGLRWDGGLHPIAATSSTFTYDPPSASVVGTVTAKVGPRLELFLYGVAGPYLTATAGVKLTVNPAATPAWSLTGSLDAGAGITLPAFDFDKSNPSILHFEKVIAHAPWPQHLYLVQCVTADCYTTLKLVRANDDGTGVTQIGGTFGGGGLGLAVNPAGTEVVFNKAGTGTDYAMSLYARNIATGVDRRLTSQDLSCPDIGTNDMWPVWSPNGQTISFQRSSSFGWSSCPSDGVYTVPAAGGAVTKVSGLTRADSPPSWNPSTSRWAISRSATTSSLFTTNTNGTGKQTLYTQPPNGAGLGFPVWSPDGGTIAVGSGDGYIYGYAPGGGRQWAMRPPGYTGSGWFSWSRDSETLFYMQYNGNTKLLYRVAAGNAGQISTIAFSLPIKYHTLGL